MERQRLEAEGQDPEQAAGHLSFRRVVDLNRFAADGVAGRPASVLPAICSAASSN